MNGKTASILTHRTVPADLDEAAAYWVERLSEADGDPGEQRAFEHWRAASPTHAGAFRRAQATHALVRSIARAPQLQALRAETHARIRRRRMRHYAVAASLLVVFAFGAITAGMVAPGQLYRDARDALAGNVYKTGVGQRLEVTLEDGSAITLNTSSRISVHYAEDARRLTLEQGQALFKVAHDRLRPFVVTAGDRQVTALGTEFDVRLSERAFEVTLLEGRVSVAGRTDLRGAADVPPPAELRPGQQFVVAPEAVARVREADVQRIVSWRRGQVFFDNERLADAVAEMNRYSTRKIVLDDPRLGAVRISGAFKTGDTASFVSALTDYFPITHARHDDEAIVLTQRPPGRG